ncbi:diguanylate cyclase domain-containing protein [Antarcticirhabdus aurantiaca]|uniref:Diguanylate cyclase n=1 Tax=Antarcticirhabdus aurantiaca TaxID=2606717 RepID=A0ACD4NI46_9HYPH|nr:diguanylate cyclase [Antarcticirhabdus aurantiaca]WAJ26464.1 diguanylate cyclase [Jeongeuplla avenae]
MSVIQHRFRLHVVLPIALLVAGLIVGVMLFLLVLAHRQTDDAVANQRALADGMLRIRLAELEKLAQDYSYWDEAYDNLFVRPNANWAAANIGPGLRQSYGVDMSFVVAPNGRSTYRMVDGVPSDLEPTQILKGGLEQLLADRAKAGPDSVRSGLLVADGAPVLVSVAPLRPFTRPDDGDPASRHVLLLADRLDDAQIAHFSEIYRLPGLRIASTAEQAGQASIEMRTLDGKASAHLAWIGDDPGGKMLRDILPLVLAVLVAFAVFSIMVLRQAERSAHKLEISERRASHDGLTGLRNRSALLDQLESAKTWPAIRLGYALLYVDLDGFKLINDTHGHGMGDDVLRIAGRRLEAAVPPGGRAYRLGGDEFAVIVPGRPNLAEVRSAGLKMIEVLSAPMDLGGVEVQIGATVGVALATSAGADVLETLRNADQALYVGKRSMKGTVRFHVEVADRPSSLVS